MKIFKYFFITIYVAIVTLSFSSDNDIIKNSPNLIQGKLKNGMEYYIFKNKKPEKRASLNLIVKAGSLLESDNQQGLAHFLEHMAFNGTEKYQKNDMIKYLQSLGLNFGGDLNAYTNFSETVYELKVPTDKKDLDTAFDVFSQWANKITLDPKEIEAEKNVVIEEWRLSQGLSQRILDAQKKLIFGDSRYSKRFPIGTVENIKNANQELLKDFYKTWYQPKNMVVVAVGDFDPKEIEDIINKKLGELKNTGAKKIDKYVLKEDKENEVVFFSDKELTSDNFNIFWKMENRPLNTVNNIKIAIEQVILINIINKELRIESKNKNAPFYDTSAFAFNLNKDISIFGFDCDFKDGKMLDSLAILIKILKKISVIGVSESDLNFQKKNYLTSLENIKNNRDSIENKVYLEEIKSFILNNSSFIEIEKEYEITKKILENIKSEDIKEIAQNILKHNFDLFISTREISKKTLPKAEEVLNTVDKTLLTQNNFNLNRVEIPKLEIKIPEKKLILNEKKESDYKIFELENGLNVMYKKTDFDKDKIYITIMKKQGSSSLNNNLYLNSLFLSDIVSNSGVANIDYKNISDYFSDKNFDVSFFISDYTDGFSIESDKKNIDEAMKYFRAMISEPRFSDDIISSTLEKTRKIIENRELSPRFILKKTAMNLLTENHPRREYLKLDQLSVINRKNLEKTFTTMFSDFNGFFVTIVGSIDEAKAKEIIEKYIANLPVSGSVVTAKSLNVRYTEKKVEKTIVKGVDKKAIVKLFYPYRGKYTQENAILYSSFSELLNLIFIEEVREKLGGVYSINSNVTLDEMNFGENMLYMSFSTDPKRVNEVIEAVKNSIYRVQNGEFSKEKIGYLKKNFNLNYETIVKKNSFWVNYLNKKNLNTSYEICTPIMYNSIVSFDSIINFSKKAVNKDNYVQVVLLPEKEE